MPRKKVNQRGVLKVDGLTDFNPDANLNLDVGRHSVKNKEKKKGCCK